MWLLLVNRYSYRVYFLIITWNGQQSTLLWMHLYKSLLRIYNMFDITNWYFIYKYFHFDEVSVVLNQFLLQRCFEKLKSLSSLFFLKHIYYLAKKVSIMLAEYCKWFYKAQKNLEMRRENNKSKYRFSASSNAIAELFLRL